MAADADIEQHKDSVFDQIAWGNDKLFGYRGHSVYLIDWDTYKDKLIILTNGELSVSNLTKIEDKSVFFE